MDMFELIKTRRSTRKFTNRPLKQEQLEQIIEAGRYAPSGGNNQTSHFIVIENQNILKKLATLVQEEFVKMEIEEGMYQSLINSINASQKGNYVFHYSPAALIVLANQKNYGNAMADCSCALENMMLMCNALDLGSCWINQLRWLNENKTIVEYLETLGLTQDEIVCGALSVGYPDTEDGLPHRKSLDRKGNKVTFIK